MKTRVLLIAAAAAFMMPGMPATAQEIAEGQWINLFDGETLYGWTTFGDVPWQVRDGVIQADAGDSGFIATTAQFADFELEATLRVTGEGSGGLAVRAPVPGHPREHGSDMIVLPAGEANVTSSTVRIRALGGAVEAWVNGAEVPLTVDNKIGHITVQYHKSHGNREGLKVEVREMRLRPLAMASLFNGENLDGWNIIPDKPSVFTAVDGMLNVKNGPGQIETVPLFKNFILQLDVLSNGEHLNSGAFFRGPVGVFWRGYEVQVRNQWVRNDRAKPVDFGTGGIYGVDAARKVVSNDYEWFTMTVVAYENHMAAWVNGHQVSDFIDTRPISTDGDGKSAYVNTAGTIHLQGHDPGTDLSFKNIHIQAYPE